MSGAGVLARLRRWWNARAEERALRREAERLLDDLFARRDLLARTSLRVDHRSRCQLLDLSEAPHRIGFGIVRHPRPYAFSRQFHEVVELWIYEPASGRLERVKGVNLTRQRGSDSERH